MGDRFGPFSEALDRDLCDQLRVAVGEPIQGELAPLGVLPLVTLRSLRQALDGIIPGGVLTGQRFLIHSSVPVEANIEVGVAVSAMSRRGENVFTTFTFDCRHDGRLAAAVEWTILAPRPVSQGR